MAKKRRRGAETSAAADDLIDVVAAIDAGEKAPDDLMLGLQIDSKRLTLVNGKGKARIGRGLHTASWGVVSVTVRPLPFGVTVVAGDGRVLLNRPNETTGASDGMGVGADLFTA